jgi:hypothetical protein
MIVERERQRLNWWVERSLFICVDVVSYKTEPTTPVGLQSNTCSSFQHQTDTTITTDVATPRAKPRRKRRPGRLSRLKHILTFVGKSKLDTWHPASTMKAEAAEEIPATGREKRTPGMTRRLRHCYRTHGVVAALGWLYRQSCRLHSAELQPKGSPRRTGSVI